jgi:hypothetical protein
MTAPLAARCTGLRPLQSSSPTLFGCTPLAGPVAGASAPDVADVAGLMAACGTALMTAVAVVAVSRLWATRTNTAPMISPEDVRRGFRRGRIPINPSSRAPGQHRSPIPEALRAAVSSFVPQVTRGPSRPSIRRPCAPQREVDYWLA